MKYRSSIPLLLTVALSFAGCSTERTKETATDASSPSAKKSGHSAPAPAPVRIIVPAGTRLSVSLIDSISTDKNKSGDRFEASLVEPIVVDGKTVVEKGTKVRGRLVEVKESGRVKGRASIRMVLTDIVHEDKNIEITTKAFAQEAQGTKKRDAGMIGGGAGLGAAIGAIAGGGKGAALGAAVGGGAGTGAVMATKGKELHYPSETRLNFTLEKEVELPTVGVKK